MKKLLGLAAIAAIGLVGCSSNPSIDTISSASVTNYYESSTLTGEELQTVLENPSLFGSVTIATVNKDGSPNSGTLVPGKVSDTTLVIRTGGNSSTLENLKREEMGVITIYQHNAEAEEKEDRNRGVKLVVTTETDADVIAVYDAELGIEEADADSRLYLNIDKELPLG